MKILKNISLNDETLSAGWVAFTALLLYVFMFAVRLVWAYYDYSNPNFLYDGYSLINSTDGYRFAAHTKEILAGLQNPQDGSPGFRPVAVLAAYLAKIGFTKEWVFFYLPPILGSLSAVGVLLLGVSVGLPTVGIAGAIFTAVSAGFFVRTSPGYFDDDMLSMVLPIFVSASMIWALNTKKAISILALVFLAFLLRWWYPQSAIALGLISIGALGWVLKYARYEPMGYVAIAALVIPSAPLPWWAKLAALIGVYIFFTAVAKNNKKIYLLFWVAVAGAVLFGVSKFGLGEISRQWNNYVFKAETINVGSLKYYASFKTIAEARALTPLQMIENIAASQIVFWVALVGVFLLVAAKRVSIVLLPVLLLGFLAMDGGNRLTPYAIPILGLGIGAFALFATKYIDLIPSRFTEPLFLKIKKGHIVRFAVIVFGIIATMPSAFLLAAYTPKPDLQKQEIEALKLFDSTAKQGDYLMTWWDYGSPIRYYTKALPHSDSSYNEGFATYPEAAAMTSMSQSFSAHILADAAEFRQSVLEGKASAPSTLEGIFNSSGNRYKNINELLSAMGEKNYVGLKKTRDVYLFLPYRQAAVFSAIQHFAERDLLSGEKKYSSFFKFSTGFTEDESTITMDNGISLDKKNGMAYLGNSKMPLKSATVVAMDANGKSVYEESKLREDGVARLIYIQNAKAFIVCDERSYNSAYVQMYLFDKYDPEYFEPVVSSQLVKIYKIKR